MVEQKWLGQKASFPRTLTFLATEYMVISLTWSIFLKPGVGQLINSKVLSFHFFLNQILVKHIRNKITSVFYFTINLGKYLTKIELLMKFEMFINYGKNI